MPKAIALFNMGGPSNLGEVRVFLSNMFNDPNILTLKSSFLRSLVAFVIATFRTSKAKDKYREIGSKSPLLGITQKLASKVETLSDTKTYIVMRYTPPFAKDVIRQMKQDGVDQLTMISMYPQYSTTTVKSSFEQFYDEMKKRQFSPKTVEISRFYERGEYNEIVVEKIIEALRGEDAAKFRLICSCHSLPIRIIEAGDSYKSEVEAHFELIKIELLRRGLSFAAYSLGYQSKLGPVEWIKPSTEELIASCAGENLLICPLSFTIDNLETMHELHIEYKEVAERAGVLKYLVSECPNDSNEFAKFLTNLFTEHTK